MDSTFFITKGLPITDWIQAVGAIIAIIAGIWGFISLFKKDEDKQRQIDSLTKLAEESKNQTKQMIEQIRLMREQTELMKKSGDREDLERKNNIKPSFVYGGGSSESNGFIHRLRNDGKDKALVTELVIIKNTNLDNIRLDSGLPNYINQGKEVGLFLSYRIPHNQTDFQCEIHFEDLDHNKYKQLISSKNGGIIIRLPENV